MKFQRLRLNVAFRNGLSFLPSRVDISAHQNPRWIEILRTIAAKGFRAFLEENEQAMLSDAFWNVRLPQNLETSSISSPFFNTFVAAQIFMGDKVTVVEQLQGYRLDFCCW